jgi:hypothetical protein
MGTKRCGFINNETNRYGLWRQFEDTIHNQLHVSM